MHTGRSASFNLINLFQYRPIMLIGWQNLVEFRRKTAATLQNQFKDFGVGFML
jgi:hypothetical protein